MSVSTRSLLRAGWFVSIAGALGIRAWNALTGPLIYGYDVWGHLSYIFFLDVYRSTPYADQGWSYFHPPLHYWLGWLLAQSGNSEFLLRGLCLLGSGMSLGTAALAAWFTRIGLPERRGLPLIAFTIVAFLPVHLYASPFPGNEMTATFMGSAVIALFAWNEARTEPRLWGDLGTGATAGLALLTKFSGLIPLLAVIVVLGWKMLRPGTTRPRRARLGIRACAILLPALLIAGPYYVRNVAEFGTPFKLSRDLPLVANIESIQPQISRSVWDFVRIPPSLFVDSYPGADHMMKSVWGSAYVNVWSDNFGASQLLTLRKRPKGDSLPAGHPLRPARGTLQPLATLMTLTGVIPTLLALFGGAVAARGMLHRRGDGTDTLALVLGGGTLASFALFVWQVPIWSSMKATYLLNASVPFGYLVARGLGALSGGPVALRAFATGAVAVAALISGVVFTTDLGFPARRASIEAPGVEVFFGERHAIRRPAARLKAFERTMKKSPAERPFWASRVALAYAYNGRYDDALRLLDAALVPRPSAEILATRGAIMLQLGRFAAGERDLRQALELEPALPPAWMSLAWVLEKQGSPQAAETRATAARMRNWIPRGFPYGVGNGHISTPAVSTRRMLEIDESGQLKLYRPPRARTVP